MAVANDNSLHFKCLYGVPQINTLALLSYAFLCFKDGILRIESWKVS